MAKIEILICGALEVDLEGSDLWSFLVDIKSNIETKILETLPQFRSEGMIISIIFDKDARKNEILQNSKMTIRVDVREKIKKLKDIKEIKAEIINAVFRAFEKELPDIKKSLEETTAVPIFRKEIKPWWKFW